MCIRDSIFVDRSRFIFDHVLAFVIDNLHPYPVQYFYELDYYGINYNINKLYDPDKLIIYFYKEIELLRAQQTKTDVSVNQIILELKTIRNIIENTLRVNAQDRHCSGLDCHNYATISSL